MTVNHIIVQAGGKGTRLEHLTANKPKALVPIENLPMLFHLFRKYPNKNYVIIADYKREVLREYLEAFAEVNYQIVDADGEGTCSGVRCAAELLPKSEPFMLIWSDLILPADFELPERQDNYIGISQTFPCRWKYENGALTEQPSEAYGVAGLFIFQDKSFSENIPKSGELVRYFKESGIAFKPLGLAGTREFGTLTEYDKMGEVKTRPFNKITVSGDKVVKEPLDAQGRELAERETAWYEYAKAHGMTAIPHIYETSPLVMERINGKNIYDSEPDAATLEKITDALKQIHGAGRVRADSFSVREAYYGKTVKRLDKVRNLIPFSEERQITVNGRACRNVFFYRRELERLIETVRVEDFAFIHGDCTFSNLMLRDSGEPALIDPRGYFGHTKLYGDVNYDWAKLYYSIVGNYDQFNLKNFRLTIGESGVEVNIKSNGWEKLEDDFFRLTGADRRIVKLIHAVIWLSLTTYAWQDYDSVCGAFYNGLYYLEELL